jgi:hypothetical protein
MTNNIVNVNVSQTQAPAASTLQGTGAFISQGGTTTSVGTTALITQMSDLTAILKTGLALTSLTWSTGVVTATASAVHGFTIGDTFPLTIAGAVPVGYNGTYAVTVTTTTAFTFAIASNPGTETTPGTYVSGSVTELTQMATTFFAQGSNVSVLVLELGEGSPAEGVTALTTYITNNPVTVYSYLVPRNWDAVSSFLTLCTNYQSTTSKTYFHVTTTNTNYTSYTALQKAVMTTIEAPVIGATEFSAAAQFWQTLNYAPSSTNKVTPLSFSFVFGVTPYPRSGNGTKFAAWKAAGVNFIGTGYEGGISTAILFWGTTMDVKPFNYWYAVDWLQINIDLNISNAVINGSNNPINPLYLNQPGINTLQSVGAGTLTSAITFGMLLGQVIQSELSGPAFSTALATGVFAGQAVINAVPFVAYYQVSPSDYTTGTYNGFSITCTPLRGFESITFNINVTSFVSL